ncbi:MAG TPA: hypothetical protein ENK05_02075 [Gammaproteobacteria bacterium]|nr:hypothetical protein [Gammaproteobacteria bacterium]
MITNKSRRAFFYRTLSVLTALKLTGCGGGGSGSGSSAVPVTAPSILAHPQDQSVRVGELATFVVDADGTPPLSYQWYRDGVAIPGASSSSYTVAVSSSSDAAVFSVVVSNAAGSAQSRGATLVVTVPATAPVILTQPSDSTVDEGDTATFQVNADGSAPLSYQWQRDGVDIPGANAPSYTTPVLSVGDDALFAVVVSNSAGSVRSRDAILSVSALSITVDSTAITVDSIQITVDST